MDDVNDSNDFNGSGHVAAPTSVSRRRFVAIAGGALGLAGLAALRPSVVAAELGAATLDEPGTALQRARRIPPSTVTSTTIDDTTETTDTTEVTDTTEPTETTDTTTPVSVPEGRLRFPIVVGENDSCWVADNFGDCRGTGCSRSHEGVDIMADRGLAIVAPVGGRLEKRYDDRGLLYGAGNGWTLVDDDGDVHYRFFHLDRHEAGLEEGDDVEEGQIIGYVGNTGTSGAQSDTNYHLHFEYRPGNVAEDSYPILHRVDHVTWEH